MHAAVKHAAAESDRRKQRCLVVLIQSVFITDRDQEPIAFQQGFRVCACLRESAVHCPLGEAMHLISRSE